MGGAVDAVDMSMTQLDPTDAVATILARKNPTADVTVGGTDGDLRVCSIDETVIAVEDVEGEMFTTEDLFALTVDEIDEYTDATLDYDQVSDTLHLFAVRNP